MPGRAAFPPSRACSGAVKQIATFGRVLPSAPHMNTGSIPCVSHREVTSLIHAVSGSGTPVATRQPVVSQEFRNRRQHPRTRVSWPVVVETRTQRYRCQVMDISNHGAKIMTRARLRVGAVVRLQIIPPDGTPLRVGALVWRVDTEGGGCC